MGLNKLDCPVVEECSTFLVNFPERLPYRCHECTLMVQETLQRIKDQVTHTEVTDG